MPAEKKRTVCEAIDQLAAEYSGDPMKLYILERALHKALKAPPRDLVMIGDKLCSELPGAIEARRDLDAILERQLEDRSERPAAR